MRNSVIGSCGLRSPALCIRNSGLNLAAKLINVGLGLLVVPFVIRGLGEQAYGLLALVWIAVGYFGVFDLSISRATIKYIAEDVARGDLDRVSRTLWTSVLSNLLLGTVAALALAGLALCSPGRVLPGDAALAADARWALIVAAAALPFSMAQGAMLGAPAALQRFDVVNLLDLGYSFVRQLGTLALVWAGCGIRGIVAATTVLSVVTSAAYMLAARRLLPNLGWPCFWDGAAFRRLVSFGGWVTVSQLVNPLLVYLDRLSIGWLVSVSAVTYYTVPCEMAMRLALIPASLSATLFPALSAAGVRGGASPARFVKYLLFLMAPLVGVLVVFARDILTLWLGPAFARESSEVLQILAIAVLLSSLARIPSAALQAVGRPELPAGIQLLQLPVHVLACWLLISMWGIVGAALATALRAVFECALLAAVYRVPRRMSSPGIVWGLSIAVAAAGALLLVRAASGLLLVRAVGACVTVCAYLFLIWKRGLTSTDRGTFALAVPRWSRK